MKKGVVFITILVILSMFLTGCSNANPVQNNTSSGSAYVGGKEGLAISFVENQPPKEVFDDKQGVFSINVKVENKGEFALDANTYKLTLTGIDFNSFGTTNAAVTGQTKDQRLEKVKKSVGQVIPGDYAFFDSLSNLAYQSKVNGQIGPFNLRAALCYPYETEASSKVCILQDLYGRSGRTPLCKAIEDKSVENSGAPVQVTKLSETVVGADKISLTFTINHVGDSKDVVFSPSSDHLCDLVNLNTQNKVGVKVEVGTIPSDQISCAGLVDGKANLYGDSGAEVRCTVSLTSPIDQEVPVKITLDYDYYQYADTQMTVKQMGT